MESSIYNDFLDSIDKVKEKTLLMSHLPSDVMKAKILYRGYLTDEECQERQYEGRFWDIIGSDLLILVDNETSIDEFNSSDDKSSERNPYYISNDHKEYDMLLNDLEGDEKTAVEMRLSGKNWEQVRKALGIRCTDFRAFQNALRERILTYI